MHEAIRSMLSRFDLITADDYVNALREILQEGVHPRQSLKIKIEVDTDPPGGFQTESRYVLQPIPFAVRTYTLPDLFAGKLHAVLCRRWKSRVLATSGYSTDRTSPRSPL